MRTLLLAAVLLLTTTLAAAEVRVFAAASLTESLQEIARAYEQRTGDRILFNFGASSMLARQIEQGAPADLFFSADEEKMNQLARKQLVVPSTRASVLGNQLAIVVPKNARFTSILNVKSLALAEPSTVPAGIYAKRWLVSKKWWDRVAPYVIPTDNVRAALAAVEAGNADAAIVYRTDAAIAKRSRIAMLVNDGPVISYPFALLRDAEQPAAARRFLAHVQSQTARKVFERYGFRWSRSR